MIPLNSAVQHWQPTKPYTGPFKIVSRKFQQIKECFEGERGEGDLLVFHYYFKEVQRVSQESFKGVSRKFQESFKEALICNFGTAPRAEEGRAW